MFTMENLNVKPKFVSSYLAVKCSQVFYYSANASKRLTVCSRSTMLRLAPLELGLCFKVVILSLPELNSCEFSVISHFKCKYRRSPRTAAAISLLCGSLATVVTGFLMVSHAERRQNHML